MWEAIPRNDERVVASSLLSALLCNNGATSASTDRLYTCLEQFYEDIASAFIDLNVSVFIIFTEKTAAHRSVDDWTADEFSGKMNDRSCYASEKCNGLT